MSKFEFWPFPMIRNHGESRKVTKIFLDFARSERLRIIKDGRHEVTVACEHGEMMFWTENKYYAWGMRGTFSGVNCGEFRWRNEMPSRYAARAMRQALDRLDKGRDL